MASSDLADLLQQQLDKLGGIPVIATTRQWINIFLWGGAAATPSSYDNIATLPFDGFLEEVIVNYTVASSSGTLQIQRIQSTEANGSGDNLLVAAQSLSGTANTRYYPALVDSDVRQFSKGDVVGLVDAGTLTNLANLSISLRFRVTSTAPFV